MNIQIIVGSIREGRTAIKLAKWAKQAVAAYQPELTVEIVDLKTWDLPIFVRPLLLFRLVINTHHWWSGASKNR